MTAVSARSAGTADLRDRPGVPIRLELLTRRYGPVLALDRLDLDIAGGEFLALLGPSGCGKTTALRAIAGFDRPDEGRVLLGGRDITGTPASKRDMGMVFQAYSLFPNLTVAENVAFGLRVRRRAKAERTGRAAELLDLVGLADRGARYPHQLSGGQQQRVALARALAVAPQVLLLDEPLSALDAQVRVQLREEIRRIQLELGITTVFVTHDQAEALSVADTCRRAAGRPAGAGGLARRALRAPRDRIRRRVRRDDEPRARHAGRRRGAVARHPPPARGRRPGVRTDRGPRASGVARGGGRPRRHRPGRHAHVLGGVHPHPGRSGRRRRGAGGRRQRRQRGPHTGTAVTVTPAERPVLVAPVEPAADGGAAAQA
jgi:putative spermidine/putrescine transport system ATP-binding protein